MKAIFVSIIVFTLFLNVYSQENSRWEVLNEGAYFRTIDFVNENVGWIAGDGTLLKTEDGGETWRRLSFEDNWEYPKIDFCNETVGWAHVFARDISMRILLKSIDGGESWSIQEELQDKYLRILQVIDDSVVYVIEYYDNSDTGGDIGNIIWKTSDGGSSWIDISPDLANERIHSSWFFNTEVGIVAGHYYDGINPKKGLIQKTADGGNSWEEHIFPEFSDITDLQFINDSIGYFLDYRNDTCFLYATTDTGKTWTIRTQSPIYIHSFFYLDENTVYAVMNDRTSWFNSCVMKSMDGGQTWTKKNSNQLFINGLKKIFFNSTNSGFIIAENSVLRNTNNSDQWQLQTFSYPFRGVSFINKDKGFVFGGAESLHFTHGEVFTTYDGGKNWSLSLALFAIVNSCFFLNEHTGLLLTTYNEGPGLGIIYKTENAGENWTLFSDFHIDSVTYFYPSDICFMNEQTGWAAGIYFDRVYDSLYAALFETLDGGENWHIAWAHPDKSSSWIKLSSIHIVGTTGWAVGDSGMIVKYTQQNQWQLRASVTDLPLHKVFFSDEQHGWIAGGYLDGRNTQSIMLQTRDGGQTWSELRFNKYFINDMYFTDSLHGWAVGSDTSITESWPPGRGVILYTSNGGEDWTAQVEGLPAPLTALHFTDNIGWAVGSNGLILKTDGITWIDQTTGDKYLSKYQLFQNYPNPFNPSTKIEFELPKTSEVTLKVFNILGEEVARLVSDDLSAGSYSYEWNASNFASGVYLYRLQAGDYVVTRKMILMK